MTELVLFSRPECPFCVKAKVLAEEIRLATKLPFRVIVLDDQPSYAVARAHMVEMSGGSTKVPQVFLNGHHLPGGYTKLKERYESGELLRMMENLPVLPLPFFTN